MTGADILVQALRDRGVEFISVLCGNGLNPLLVACHRAGVRMIDTRNEQAASYIADAHARLTGQIGVCAVSSAVGHANALIGVVNAHFDGAPVLLVSGCSPLENFGRGTFQELDQISMVRSLTKYAELVVRPDHIGLHVHEAVQAATTGRPGPVHLTIPKDVLQATVDPCTLVPCRGTAGRVHQPCAGDPAQVAEAALWIARAQRPLVVAGSGVFYAKGEGALADLAHTAALPVVVPIWDRGCIPTPDEHFVGVIGAASGQARLLPDADLVLLVGARVDYRVGYGRPPAVSPDAKIVRVDADAGQLHQGMDPDLAILGDPASVLTQLADQLRRSGAPSHQAWLDDARTRDRTFRSPWRDTDPPSVPPMTGRHVVDALREVLNDETVLLVDGGNIGQWAHVSLCDRYPGHWLTCGASGVVGWGLPGAIGAKLTYPDRPVVLLTGDGALGFTIAEFETAVKHRTPFVVLLADDQAWGIVVSGQQASYGPDGVLASRMAPVRYDLVAEGFGAKGMRVERPGEIAAALREGLKADVPVLIQVPIATGGPADGG